MRCCTLNVNYGNAIVIIHASTSRIVPNATMWIPLVQLMLAPPRLNKDTFAENHFTKIVTSCSKLYKSAYRVMTLNTYF